MRSLIASLQGYSGMSQSVAPEGRQSRGRFLIAVGWETAGEREMEIEREANRRRRHACSRFCMRYEGRVQVRSEPTLSPSKSLTTFRPAPRAA